MSSLRESFDESKFEPYFQYRIYIHVPDSLKNSNTTKIVFSIQYDVETSSDMEYVQLGRGNYYDMKYEQLDPVQKKFDTEMSLEEDKFYVQYYRRMRIQYKKWKTKRNTGMEITWHYTSPVQSEGRPETSNRLFTRLVNAIHHNQYQPEDLYGLGEVQRNWL